MIVQSDLVNSPVCPFCGDSLSHEDRYCAHCGLQVIQPCPACGESHQLHLKTLQVSAQLWCDNQGASPLYACEGCGRWLTSATQFCPDPDCGSVVEPPQPCVTGRTAGHTLSPICKPLTGWTKGELFRAEEPLYALATLNGRMFAWVGNRFGPVQALEGKLTLEGGTPFGKRLQPSLTLPQSERLTIFGSTAVLAFADHFEQCSLGKGSDHEQIEPIGKPRGQVASAHGWAGWCEVEEELCLLYAVAGSHWLQSIQVADLSPDAAASVLSPPTLTLFGNCVYWVSAIGKLGSLDLKSGEVTLLTPAGNRLPVSIFATEFATNPKLQTLSRKEQGARLLFSLAPLGEESEVHDIELEESVPSALLLTDTELVFSGAQGLVRVDRESGNHKLVSTSSKPGKQVGWGGFYDEHETLWVVTLENEADGTTLNAEDPLSGRQERLALASGFEAHTLLTLSDRFIFYGKEGMFEVK